MLDYKIRFNTNPRYQLQTDIAEEVKKRMKPFLERKKRTSCSLVSDTKLTLIIMKEKQKQLRLKLPSTAISSTQSLKIKQKHYHFAKLDSMDRL